MPSRMSYVDSWDVQHSHNKCRFGLFMELEGGIEGQEMIDIFYLHILQMFFLSH